MDYKELIDLFRRYAEGDFPVVADWAAIIDKKHLRTVATAITDLLARTEAAEQKVNELERALSDASKIVDTMQESTIPFYRRRAEEAEARAEKAEKERDAAVSDLETIMAYNSDTCQFCKNGQCYVRGGTKPCLPNWRGQKEE